MKSKVIVLFHWFKTLRDIVSNHKNEVNTLNQQVKSLSTRINILEGMIKSKTEIAASLDYRGTNFVIMVGRYKNQDYVEVVNMEGADFPILVSQLRDMKKRGIVSYVDAPPDIRATVLREMKF